MSVLVSLASSVLAASGCDKAPSKGGGIRPLTTQPFAIEADFFRAADFEFVFKEGGALDDSNVTRINSDGDCQYTFRSKANGEDIVTKVASFKIDGLRMKKLKQLLADTNFFNLSDSYVDTTIQDGDQHFITVQAAGVRKTIHFSNRVTKELQSIEQFVQQDILEPNYVSIGQATEAK